MGQPRTPEASLLVVACFSRHETAHAWAEARLVERFGPVLFASEPYAFTHTAYYARDMGPQLTKRFLVFDGLRRSDLLPEAKLATNALEAELGATGEFPEPRPLNLDPGLLQLGKFLLATTKDQAHRIYLRDGIFAEVTLRFSHDQFEPWPWTYADYREPFVRDFLRAARGRLYNMLRRPPPRSEASDAT